MSFIERIDNVYAIDAKMFGFAKYCSSYLVKGRELALIDTGLNNQREALLDGIRAHGFSPKDISTIFITHAHADHIGNVTPLLQENPKASVYVHPDGLEMMLNPSIMVNKIRAIIPKEKDVDRGVIQPVPRERIKFFKDGDTFDLGNGEKLRVVFTPGHQPEGLVMVEESNRGIFINDLVGNYLADAGAHYVLNPFGSNHQQAIASLKKLVDIPVKYLYLGHYGIVEQPKQVMTQTINKMQKLLDIGARYIKEGKPEMIGSEVLKITMVELEKLRKARGEKIFEYATGVHQAYQMKVFTQWCLDNLK